MRRGGCGRPFYSSTHRDRRQPGRARRAGVYTESVGCSSGDLAETAMPTTLSPENLSQRARFVFRGAVQKLGAATMPEVPVNDRTAVVRVEEVRQAPPELARRVGQEVTVQLAPGGQQIKEGDELVFYTN